MKILAHISLLVLLSLAPNRYSHCSNLHEIKQTVSDSVITTKITAKITKNKDLNPLKISVSTQHGIVKLKGNVRNISAYRDAIRIVRHTKGVRGLNARELHIREVNTGLTDMMITAKVETTILKAKLLDDAKIPLVGINASTNNGIVTLSGEIDNSKVIPLITKRIAAVKGVKKVISHIKTRKNKP